MDQYIANFSKVLKKHQRPDLAVPMKKYMRDQFEFFGIKADARRELFKEYMNSQPLPSIENVRPIIKEMWSMKERDYQYCAVELLIKCKKMWSDKDASFWEYLITHKSWWDSVDYLANKVVGPWFLKFPVHIKPVTGKWNRSDNI